jgi:hypothetical protein
MPSSLHLTRYLSGAGQATAAYALTVPADGAFASKEALLDVNANLVLLAMGALGEDSGGERWRGLHLFPFGQGANNATITGARLYAVNFTGEGGKGWRGPLVVNLLATLAVTLGNAVGSAPGGSVLLTAADRIADTITLTKSAYLKELERTLGLDTTSDASGNNGARAYSPADDTQGCVWIPDCGNADAIFFDTDLGTATAANFLVRPWS